MPRGRRRFSEDDAPEPDETGVAEEATQEQAAPTPAPAPTAPTPTGLKVLLRQPKGKPHAHYLPDGEKVSFRICVNGQYYEHVAEDEAGCWIYQKS